MRAKRRQAAINLLQRTRNPCGAEERSDGILLRPAGRQDLKLSWEDTAREMATAREDWRAWDAALADGLDETPWESHRPRSKPLVRFRFHSSNSRTSCSNRTDSLGYV
jgi:hypothetical protein